ncbi:MAG TPA: hypothetical protein PLV68_18340, partial [Ilumatobacteraceae bacterium]|nr:hypothetical protein [Ilumatobacteraceae bacterium]
AAFYADERLISNQTMALVDLTAIDELDAALAGLVDLSGANATAAAVGLARSAARSYSFANSPDRTLDYNLFDIGDLVKTLAVQNPLLAPSVDAVLDALGAAVVYDITGSLSTETHGLAIYLPPAADVADPRYFDLPGLSAWQSLVRSYLDTTSSVQVPTAFTDDDKYIEGRWTSQGFEIGSTYDPAAEATVVDARIRYGTYWSDYTEMMFFGSEPLLFGNGEVRGVWDPQMLTVTDGNSQGFAYATIDLSGDGKRAIFSIPLDYEGPNGRGRVDLRIVVEIGGGVLSKEFVLYSDTGIGRAPIDPRGQLWAIALVQDLATFDQRWERTHAAPFAADIDALDVYYEYMSEATPILAQLELHALDGSVDFVYAGDAVPAFYYDERNTYPLPG